MAWAKEHADWARTSALIAHDLNLKKSPGTPMVAPDRFNPYRKKTTRRRVSKAESDEAFAVLAAMFGGK